MPSLPKEYFDNLYRENPDPWGFADSEYEAAKYATTIEALPRARYYRALEVGCSIGVLTGALAEKCDHVIGVDVSSAAIQQARERNADCPNLQFDVMQFPGEYPDGPFDLILLSEVLYYFSPEKLRDVAERTLVLAGDRADIALVHWLGPTPDYPLTGQQAVDIFIDAVGSRTQPLSHLQTEKYRVDIMRCSTVPATSRPTP